MVYVGNTQASLLPLCVVVMRSYTELTDTDIMRTTIPVTVLHISDDNLCITTSCNCLMQHAVYICG